MSQWLSTHVTSLAFSLLQKKFTPKPFSPECRALWLCKNVYDGANRSAKASRLVPITFVFLLLFLPYTLDLIPCTSAAYAASTLTVAWDKNAETDVIGYKFHYGTVSKNYQHTVDVQNNTNCTISGLAEGTTYYFAATAYRQKH